MKAISLLKTFVLFFSIFPFSTLTYSQEVEPGSFYVDHKSGFDANDGRAISEGGTGPWKTIQKAASTVKGGDTVYVRDGVYFEPKGLGIASDSAGIEIVNEGREGEYIRLLGFPGERPVIDMQGQAACFSIFGGSYIEISGFELRNCDGGGVWIRSGSERKNHNIIISNNIIHHIDGVSGGNVGGVRADHISDSKISDNMIYHIRVGGEMNENASGIHSYRMGNMVIEHNEISDASNGVFHKHPNFIGEPVGEFRYNIIKDVKNAFRFENTEGLPEVAYHKDASIHHNVVFEGNFLYDNTFRAKTQSSGLSIFNNTIVGSGVTISGFSGVNIFNNIMYGSAYIRVQYKDDVFTSDSRHGGSLRFVDYNIYYPDFYAILGFYGSQSYRYGSLQEWQSVSGSREIERLTTAMDSSPDLHSKVVDPLFVNVAVEDYRVSETSPAKTMGRGGSYVGAYGGSSLPGVRNIRFDAKPSPPDLSID
ncbi:hypothetical protein KEHDKFFH_08400 [Marinobacter maroccanus]|uniref:Uncharacterized protein n=1 Tax=Marinobacter maroccanus TaxID=2055143 RepID=A0A2S5ZBF5_9GAMM|nr:DUF1565 domain-containing protein [Marinobacter maroccanus]PPI84713.1 hypothetical protein KEHDKFFH_08400 [Marinobacter maroccanus]